MVTALTEFRHFSPYCDVTGNLGVKTAHSPVTIYQWKIKCQKFVYKPSFAQFKTISTFQALL